MPLKSSMPLDDSKEAQTILLEGMLSNIQRKRCFSFKMSCCISSDVHTHETNQILSEYLLSPVCYNVFLTGDELLR